MSRSNVKGELTKRIEVDGVTLFKGTEFDILCKTKAPNFYSEYAYLVKTNSGAAYLLDTSMIEIKFNLEEL